MDFVTDQLGSRRFRVLNVVDDYSGEMVGQLVSVSISGTQGARVLDQLMELRAKPNKVVCDNGTEFNGKAMFFWSKESKLRPGFIKPGKPTQNAFFGSLNGKFRNECLNRHWFRTLDKARYEIDIWRHQYNHVRPHSSLGDIPPVVFATKAA
jgi:putative transposase